MPLRAYLSANIKARREALRISQEKLAEMAGISIQMIKGIEGRTTWVSDKLLVRLADVLNVQAFQLLIPTNYALLPEKTLITALLSGLRQNLKDEIDSQFDKALAGT
ncbi:MAG: helix-turn-helix transcriptional regulator [Spirochaetaceae bacterium]|jgi:transcriptional regulator with XRE-family HTH domain|nr:helix-turn-helix transcriptional regulator [Spirochaetaceae bacterium]